MWPKVYHRFAKPLPKGYHYINELLTLEYMASKMNLRLSPEAKLRLKWMDFYAKTRNAALTARHFGIAESTLWYWKAWYDPMNIKSLESKSRKPKTSPKQITPEVRELIVQVKRENLRWGPKKLKAVLKRDYALGVSDLTIYRVLKKRDLIIPYRSRRKVVRVERKDCVFAGERVQVDLKHLRFSNGEKAYQATAIDCASKIEFAWVYRTKHQDKVVHFLGQLKSSFPFRVQEIQTDNGSEFKSLVDK